MGLGGSSNFHTPLGTGDRGAERMHGKPPGPGMGAGSMGALLIAPRVIGTALDAVAPGRTPVWRRRRPPATTRCDRRALAAMIADPKWSASFGP
jgi:hypothetical protein